MRSSVDLPQPEGPPHAELAVTDIEADALDGLETGRA